ncbi:MAG: bifunctional (p)ppGpp synthetase/guanosine-3',5'-bis(diphosphate) 3'-pyrophosphohydrolase [Candidatus Moranbacteria bacterium]|nr:bifunctional (p)ppGpp synthetase/guanosine-3',5'-bis(diphosphate) 3'-pyrophosphohydrolase [Candidatus Moranbacteria bacterium]
MTSTPTLQDVFAAAQNPLSAADQKFLTEVFSFAENAHRGQKRKSGEAYITHCLHVAKILAEIGMDQKTLAAGLLHDVPEDTEITLVEIEKKFGAEVAYLVDGITKLGKIKLRGSQEEYFLENLRKMFLAMAQDIRVVIIKLADRLHNMRTLEALPPEKRERIARETIEIYASIANRLGIGEIKGELEDLCFHYLDPIHYTETKKIEEAYLHEGKEYMSRVVKLFRDVLEREKITTLDVSGRTKHLFRLYKKLKRHDMDITRIYDLIAIRIIVPEIADCYEALGIIHREYRPMVGRIKDYISLPKPNGYQSLHTTVFGPEGRILEIQIRTQKMHDEAEYGIAAHWMYTERERPSWRNIFFRRKSSSSFTPPKELTWVKQLKEWQKEIGRDDKEFMEGLKIEFFKNHIFAFTPKGDIIELPEEATPIDFAYAIHSEIGNRATGAKADGKMVPLDYKVENGQVIEILATKERKKPSRDWLSFVKTSSAKSHIKRELRHNEFKIKE